ncbi:hypothetical protein HK102_004684 [Quaeritorhiza haematococci]|nr:hypothetical protein HK102_004684 [Quaeritorhiza haematococci]
MPSNRSFLALAVTFIVLGINPIAVQAQQEDNTTCRIPGTGSTYTFVKGFDITNAGIPTDPPIRTPSECECAKECESARQKEGRARAQAGGAPVPGATGCSFATYFDDEDPQGGGLCYLKRTERVGDDDGVRTIFRRVNGSLAGMNPSLVLDGDINGFPIQNREGVVSPASSLEECWRRCADLPDDVCHWVNMRIYSINGANNDKINLCVLKAARPNLKMSLIYRTDGRVGFGRGAPRPPGGEGTGSNNNPGNTPSTPGGQPLIDIPIDPFPFDSEIPSDKSVASSTDSPISEQPQAHSAIKITMIVLGTLVILTAVAALGWFCYGERYGWTRRAGGRNVLMRGVYWLKTPFRKGGGREKRGLWWRVDSPIPSMKATFGSANTGRTDPRFEKTASTFTNGSSLWSGSSNNSNRITSMQPNVGINGTRPPSSLSKPISLSLSSATTSNNKDPEKQSTEWITRIEAATPVPPPNDNTNSRLLSPSTARTNANSSQSSISELVLLPTSSTPSMATATTKKHKKTGSEWTIRMVSQRLKEFGYTGSIGSFNTHGSSFSEPVRLLASTSTSTAASNSSAERSVDSGVTSRNSLRPQEWTVTEVQRI